MMGCVISLQRKRLSQCVALVRDWVVRGFLSAKDYQLTMEVRAWLGTDPEGDVLN